MINITKPVVRTRLRRRLGKLFYTSKRKYQWLTDNKKYAKTKTKQFLPEVIFEHQSFLLRPLKDVDMQLQINKVTNLSIAIEKINNIVISPGETFSFWYLVGKPKASSGYLHGLVLNQGKIESGIGGGLCQLGNLLFWIILHSPLEITERYRHGFDVFPDVNRKIPFGAGATLSYNYIDFQFKNNTDTPYQLELFLTKEHLNGRLRSNKIANFKYDIYESDHVIEHQYWGGYTRHNRINKRIISEPNNEIVSDEVVLENHAILMYEPFLKG